MQERHKDRKRYFIEQGITTKKFVIPYIEEVIKITKDSRILEIGCGEGGNIPPFLELGCEVECQGLRYRTPRSDYSMKTSVFKRFYNDLLLLCGWKGLIPSIIATV